MKAQILLLMAIILTASPGFSTEKAKFRKPSSSVNCSNKAIAVVNALARLEGVKDPSDPVASDAGDAKAGQTHYVVSETTVGAAHSNLYDVYVLDMNGCPLISVNTDVVR